MFCSKCGKELNDEAVICTGCGCPTKNYNAGALKDTPVSSPSNSAPAAAPGFYSSADSLAAQVATYSQEVNSIWVLSLLSLILCLGIGFIFGIISIVKSKNLPSLTSEPTDQRLIMEYETARHKLKTANKMLLAGIVICVLVAMIAAPIIALSM